MSPLDDARAALLQKCDTTTFPGGIHAVSFQPTPTKANEDRYVVQEWDDISGPPWLFLAVLDGHGGTDTVDYTANNLPSFLRDALRLRLASSVSVNPDEVSSLLRSQIEKFDHEIGEAVKNLCPKPEEFEDDFARKLVNGPDSDIFRRAYAGTTLAAALIDGHKKHLWAIGLGDSSVVLLNFDQGGGNTGQKLHTLHNTFTPSEYARVKLSHPSWEPNVIKDSRVLGILSVTRALGDFSFKMHSEYSRIFAKMPSKYGDFPLYDVTNDNHSPPYISATSEVRYIDLSSQCDKPSLILYTDGVNNIIEGRYLFRKEKPYTADVAAALCSLLNEPLDHQFLGEVFDHEVESRWNDNRAVELLGNILGGRDVTRLTQVLSPELLSMTGESDLYVDDTTIIVCPLTCL
ncbi:hypothetical protein D9615_006038 [Tricholomella constricta]|uniref:PPM-type phosphatase domain-containing protein n=1 Tax=Tricholomella constricta TaxID=117010 RepID=A0A8H5H9E8_9AGAR|nr:hypothetical protein D9615_006038 [Tricholomella constricta]